MEYAGLLGQAGQSLIGLLTSVDFLWLLLGLAVGTVFGVLPGLGGGQALALVLPLTFVLSPQAAVSMLIGVQGGIPTTGSVTSILINTPGTPQSAATTFDGFPLARQGKAGIAIGATAMSSLLGAFIGIFVLIAVLPLGRSLVLAFSYPEVFMLAVMGLVSIVAVSGGNVLKGFVSATLGLTIATIGEAVTTGEVRFIYGWVYLWDGINVVQALVGIFAIPAAITLFLERDKRVAQMSGSEARSLSMRQTWEGCMLCFKHIRTLVMSSLVGTIIGIIPGIGGSVANLLAYSLEEKRGVKESEVRFGQGNIRGVIAPEASNNAKDGGALVPTLIFGVPGSIDMAILLGALTIYGIAPGPRLMLEHSDTIVRIIVSLFVTNVLASTLILVASRPLASITLVKNVFLAPTILILALMGVYASSGGEPAAMVVTSIIGVLGYMMSITGYSRVPWVIGFILGPIAETTLVQTLASQGWHAFFVRPISLVLLLIIVAMLALSVRMVLRERRELGVVSGS